MPRNPEGGHGRNDLNFARFGFDVTFMIAYMAGTEAGVPRVAGN